jgi:hypothetical protein
VPNDAAFCLEWNFAMVSVAEKQWPAAWGTDSSSSHLKIAVVPNV